MNGDQSTKSLLTKMNTTLIEIVKHEWPHNWGDFLPSLINYARVSEEVCINVVSLLGIFSDEIFGQTQTLTKERMDLLRQNLAKNGGDIFSFFLQILKKSENVVLLQETLKALICYIRFLPAQFIFGTDLVEMLTIKFFPTTFQIRALECMCEITSLDIVQSNNVLKGGSKESDAYREKLYKMFVEVVNTVRTQVPANVTVPQLLQESGQKGEAYIRLFVTLSCTYLRNNIKWLEQSSKDILQPVGVALELLLQSTGAKEDEILLILTSFWEWWSLQQPTADANHTNSFLFRAPSSQSKSPYFEAVKAELADAIVKNMVRPKEVLVTRDEMRNIVESEVKQSIRLQIYKNMSSTLQQLCKVDLKVALNSISRTLQGHFGNITRQNSFSDWPLLNSVCWSIGTISNIVPDSDSKDFLVKAIQALLYLCERTPEKQDKAIVAANIMYVVRKNPRFLQRYWKLLQTVIGKLFEFMQEKFPGVQEMACETFEEIARRCRQAFSSDKQTGAIQFLDQLLQDLPRVVRYLPPKLIHQLWKGFGWIIKAEKNDELSNKLLVSVMTVPNMVWVRSISEFKKDPTQALNDIPLCQNLINVLRTNCSLCETLKQKYNQQLGKILEEMLHVYKVSAHALAQYGESHGPQSMRHDIAIAWRNIIHSSLELLNTSIKTGCLKQFDIISSSLDVVLTQFSKVLPPARDPLVYVLLTTVVETQKNKLENIVSILLRAIVVPTQQMIDNNEEFPDHRRNFFIFLRELIKNCFQSVSRLPGEQFNRIVNIILWAMKHLDQQMAEIGLQALLELLKRMSISNIANEFYSHYLAQILTDVFNVLTDTMHKGGYPLQVQILQELINLVDSGNVTTKLWTEGSFNSNVDCVKHCIVNLMHQNFPNLHQQTIVQFTIDLFKNCQNKEKFEITVQDFLIRSREVQTNI